MRVAFLGLGRMGRPMAANLVAAGFDVVVWNRTQAKAEAFAADHEATTVAASALEAARGADVVVGMLADDPAARASWLGEDGAMAGLARDSVAIEAGTISPDLARELGRRAGAGGAGFLDAPVSGSTAAATDATLTIMVGGATEALDRARPVLEALGSPVLHLGPGGAGAAMKLAVNGIIHSLNQAIGEALAVAEAAGIDREVAYGVLESSAVAAPMLGYRREQYLRPAEAPITFALRLAAKDVRLLLELAGSAGVPTPQAEANLAALRAAVEAGYGSCDMAEIGRWLQRRAPTRPAPETGGGA